VASRRHPTELQQREHLALRLHPVAADADRALAAHVAEVLGTSVDAVRVGRHCPACGSSAHGRPWAQVMDGTDGRVAAARTSVMAPRSMLGVSISRSGAHLLPAVRLGGEIGADIEEIAAVDAGWDPSLVLHPTEAGLDRTAEQRARLWAGKEAVLKLAGTGLRTPMTRVRLADHDVHEGAAPAGFVVQVALGRGPRAHSPAG